MSKVTVTNCSIVPNEEIERVNALLAKIQEEAAEHERFKNDLAALFAIRPHYTTLDGLLNNVKRAIEDRQKYAAEIGRLREGGRLPFSATLLEQVTNERDEALDRKAKVEQVIAAVCIAANVGTMDLAAQAVSSLRNEVVDLRAEVGNMTVWKEAERTQLQQELAEARAEIDHLRCDLLRGEL